MARGEWVAAAVVALGVAASGAVGQVTRTATFENYVEGQEFPLSFTDPLCEITFHDPTSGADGFNIEYSTTEFGGGNYLDSGALASGPSPSWSGNFGFSADLPAPANRVSFDITHHPGDLSGTVLTGYDGAGEIVAQEVGPRSAANPFTFEIASGQYDIIRFTVAANGVYTGYDNVSYTVLPEPAGIWLVLPAAVMGRRRRKKGRWGSGRGG